MNQKVPQGLIDTLYLLILCAFVITGMPTASFHGDEAMLIYMSSDYATVFIDGAPEQLLSYPPFEIDSPQYLRLINGSTSRYLIGAFWDAAGYTRESLPPRPGWDWGLSYPDNVFTGHRPNADFLTISRLPSALLTALGAVLMFAIGGKIGGRRVAYLASFLYTVHPVILLNGRRAMQEGPMFAFGLLTIYAAVLIVSTMKQRNEIKQNGRPPNRPYRQIGYWVLLIVGGTLTLASKHSGAIFLVGAYGWLGISAIQAWINQRRHLVGTSTTPSQTGRPPNRPYMRILYLIVSGVITLGLWIAISPAMWSDPVARFNDLLAARTQLIDIQVSIDPVAPMTFDQRAMELLSQPFISPPQHFEIASWGENAEIQQEIALYMASPLSGVQFGMVIGGILTLLTLYGLLLAVRRQLTLGLAIWFAITALTLMVNPLPWQRYYLPLIPSAILLAALGAMDILEFVLKRFERTPVRS